MANVKITELTALTDPASSDVLPIVDVGADTTKKVTIADLLENAGDGAAATPAFSFDNDKSVGMWRPGSEQLAFSTSGTTRLFIDSSGRCGIGTSSPTVLLDLESTSPIIRLTDSDATGTPECQISGAGGDLILEADRDNEKSDSLIRFLVDGSDAMRITSAGQMVIGGTSALDSDKQLTLTTTSTSGGLGILSPNNGRGDIFFGDAADDNIGQIKYSHVDDSLTIRTNAVDRFTIDSSGNLGLGLTSLPATGFNKVLRVKPASGAAGIFVESSDSAQYFGLFGGTSASDSAAVLYPSAGSLRFGTTSGVGTPGWSEKVRFDSSGRLLVGASSARSNLFNGSVTGLNQVEVTASSTVEYLGVRNTNNTNGSDIVLAKSRGTTAGSNTIVQDDDGLGSVAFMGSDGTEFVLGGRIACEVDGTPGADDMPGRLVFLTTASGASSATERMRISSTGQMRLAGAGITFNGDTAEANELDDYEEGTWTPVVADAQTGGNTGTFTTNNSWYRKIGNTVFVFAELYDIDTTGLTAGNTFWVRNLPFNISSGKIFAGWGNVSPLASQTSFGLPFANALSSTTGYRIIYCTSSGGKAALVSDLTSGTTDIYAGLAYYV